MSRGRGERRALGAGAALAVVGAAVAAALAAGGSPQDSADRQADRQTGRQEDRQSDRQKVVAERGRTVMPFDLERTTHRFKPTPTGGVQDVVADHRDDARQVGLIRAHLRKEAQAFSRGDFSDPARIHGADMPGLAELQDGHDRFEVRYEERADGAILTYATDDPALVGALHSWFEAQLGDHGAHAGPGH